MSTLDCVIATAVIFIFFRLFIAYHNSRLDEAAENIDIAMKNEQKTRSLIKRAKDAWNMEDKL